MKCVFCHKRIIPKYHASYPNEMTFKGNKFSFIELLTIVSAVLMSLLMVLFSKTYKSKCPNTIT